MQRKPIKIVLPRREPSRAPQNKALVALRKQVNKSFGANTLITLNDVDAYEVACNPTGIQSLDDLLSGAVSSSSYRPIVGSGRGYPRGRMLEIFGPEAVGKTTLALHFIAATQKAGGAAAFVDAEHALDIGYAQRIGVRVGELLVSQPDSAEQALDVVVMLAQSGNVDLIVVDSVAALVPQSELDGDMDNRQPAVQAALMSRACRKLATICGKSQTTIVWLNQTRTKIGFGFGSKTTTTGGNALKFHASIRLKLARLGGVKQKAILVGSVVDVEAVKNKITRPFWKATFNVIFGRGFIPVKAWKETESEDSTE